MYPLPPTFSLWRKNKKGNMHEEYAKMQETSQILNDIIDLYPHSLWAVCLKKQATKTKKMTKTPTPPYGLPISSFDPPPN